MLPSVQPAGHATVQSPLKIPAVANLEVKDHRSLMAPSASSPLPTALGVALQSKGAYPWLGCQIGPSRLCGTRGGAGGSGGPGGGGDQVPILTPSASGACPWCCAPYSYVGRRCHHKGTDGLIYHLGCSTTSDKPPTPKYFASRNLFFEISIIREIYSLSPLPF